MHAWSRLEREVASLEIDGRPSFVTQAELSTLPHTVQRFMQFHRADAGAPKVASMRLRWIGEFRLGRGAWMPIEAVQWNARSPAARVFHMRARMGHVIPILARDTYVEGHGRMRAKLAGMITVVDAVGPELDCSELVTWLNDAVLFAPTMLLDERTRFDAVDDHAFDVSFRDAGRTVRARVFVDERGAPTDFETTDRFLEDPDDPKHATIRGRWRTPVRSWIAVGNRVFPHQAEATWLLPRGDLTYARFTLVAGALAFAAPLASVA